MKSVSLLIIFALTLASCTVPGSLHPLTKNASEIYYNPALVGQWESNDSSDEIYLITLGDDPTDKFYNCAIISDDNNKDTAYFLVRLIQLNGLNYMDCWFNLKKSGQQNKDMINYNVPRHFFYKLNIINNDAVELYSPDIAAIRELVKNGKIKLQITDLQSLDISDDYLVISETPELQKAFIDFEKYASIVYKEKSTFTRIR
ncbi:MAG: hypothetical protein H0V30_09075 [Chitinophagaceae bacterium]|jgi:hypothetical protein|nr:hypothetical protein [Chitinophagaceae bacterium]